MDPNREGHRPEGQDFPEEKWPMRPALKEDEAGFEPLGQEPAEDDESSEHDGQNLPEEEKIEQDQ